MDVSDTPSNRAGGAGRAGEPADEELADLGRRLRFLRRARKMRLKDLAANAGCSESLLSRVENGLVMPSLTTLHRAAKALGTNVSELLAPPQGDRCVVYGPDDRPRYIRNEGTEGDGSIADSLIPFAEGRLLEGLLIPLPAGGASCGPFRHEGEEVGYILEGELEIILEGEPYRVKVGHSFFFASQHEHSYRALGDKDCRVLWINTPPTF